MQATNKQPRKLPARRRRGFEKAVGLVQGKIRKVGETRGFAVSKLLTHWADIVGAETARTALPVKVSYSRGNIGATLTLLTTGANAPMLQAQLPKIRERANACYGYGAIAKIRITQTAPVGFAEGKVAFTPAEPEQPAAPDAGSIAAARLATQDINDPGLRRALAALGENILSKTSKEVIK